MGTATYKRTRGYRNWVNRRCWLPMEQENGLLRMASGRTYRVGPNGEWRRTTPELAGRTVTKSTRAIGQF